MASLNRNGFTLVAGVDKCRSHSAGTISKTLSTLSFSLFTARGYQLFRMNSHHGVIINRSPTLIHLSSVVLLNMCFDCLYNTRFDCMALSAHFIVNWLDARFLWDCNISFFLLFPDPIKLYICAVHVSSASSIDPLWFRASALYTLLLINLFLERAGVKY